ncbi:MAG TPA: MFS transporter [Acidimicrobiales bacterium]|nr:MFS transporter [Acidimicrobiales bacterium]
MTERLRVAGGVTFRSFASRNFRLFFWGQLVSQAGTWMQSVAITWLVFDLTGSGVALGLVTAAEFLPILVLGAWAGVIADRVDRHRLMLCTQSAFLILAATLSALTLSDHITVGALFGLSLVFGIINAFDNPSRRALVVELVPEPDVPNAVGLNSALMTGSRVVGPALAGLLIAGPGAGVCFVVNAVTYVAVIAALLRMDRSLFRSSPRVAKAKGQLREGLRYLWRTPELRLPIILTAVVGTMAFNYQVTLPLLAERTFHGTASTFTLLFATLSLGSVVGALVVARRTSVGLRFLVRSGVGLALATLALAAAPTLPLAFVATLALGYCNVLMISGANTVVQLRAAPPMRGRVLALLTVVFLGSTPIGSPIIGAVSELTDVRVALALGGLATGLATAWTARQMRELAQPKPAAGLVAMATNTAAGFREVA